MASWSSTGKNGTNSSSDNQRIHLRRDTIHGRNIDCEAILNMLADGGVSDIEDLENSDEDEEEYVLPAANATMDSDSEVEDGEPLLVEESSSQPKGRSKAKNKVKHVWEKKKKFKAPNSHWKDELHRSEYPELPSPFSLFSNYYDNSFFDSVAFFTNMYYHEKTGNILGTTAEEMRKLFSIHITMGTLQFPQVIMYWTGITRIPIIAETMTRNRFFQLRQNLHLVGTSVVPDDTNTSTNRNASCSSDQRIRKDRLHKVRPMLNRFRERCNTFAVDENSCIDEQMIPFKGKLNIKQYIKNKPTKWGIKVFILCSSSGIINDFIVYQGQSTEYLNNTVKSFGLGAGTILHLATCIPQGLNYKLYFDNYFNSLDLLNDLRGKGILAAGTVRKDRLRMCPISTERDFKKGGRGVSEEIFNEHNIVVVVWFDSSRVLLASNFVGIGTVDEVSRWDKIDKEFVSVTRPEVVQLYNTSMGGVDKVDHLIALYRIFIRSRKWPLRVIFHFVDLAIVNSWLEYKKICVEDNVNRKEIMPLIKFRAEIAEALMKCGLDPASGETKRGRPSAESPVSINTKKTENN